MDLQLNGDGIRRDSQVLGSVSGELKPRQGGFTSSAHQNANGGIQRGGRHDAVPVQCDAGGLPPSSPLDSSLDLPEPVTSAGATLWISLEPVQELSGAKA